MKTVSYFANDGDLCKPKMARRPYAIHKELLMVMKNLFLEDTKHHAYGRLMAGQPDLANTMKQPVHL